jgi:hypothetical protein
MVIAGLRWLAGVPAARSCRGVAAQDPIAFFLEPPDALELADKLRVTALNGGGEPRSDQGVSWHRLVSCSGAGPPSNAADHEPRAMNEDEDSSRAVNAQPCDPRLAW